MSDEPRGLGGLFTQTAARLTDHTALVCGEDRYSFGELSARVNRLARAMRTRGARPGDLVAVSMPNSVAHVELVLACWMLGAVPFPVSYRMPDREFEAMIELGEPILVTGRRGVDLQELYAEAASLDDAPLPDVETSPWKALGSGGSTGRPKLIVDQGGSPRMAEAMAAFFMQSELQTNLLAAPLYHNAPIVWSLVHLLVGGRIVLMERFDAARWLDLVERERVGWAYVAPTMLHRIMQLDVSERDLSSVDVLWLGSAPCPEWLHRRAIEVFGAEHVFEFYGATEIGCSLIRGDEWLERPGSVGRPTVADVEIRDTEGRPLPPGEVGEVWLRPRTGGHHFAYRGAEATIDRDDFVTVGDMGHLDEDGYLYLADRRTDLIISGGANIYPAEVEAALLEHPAVADVAVVGLPDDEWGHRVHAIVETVDGGAVSPEGLDGFGRERLASYKLPRSWEFVDELPRDPSGKIRRSKLRDARS